MGQVDGAYSWRQGVGGQSGVFGGGAKPGKDITFKMQMKNIFKKRKEKEKKFSCLE